MATLTFLGNDSGFGLKNNSAYFEKDNELFIIDCGFTVFNEVKNKFDFSKYKCINLIISHLHNDHAGSLSQLILYLWFIYKIKTTVISNCVHIKEYLDITGTPPESYEIKKDLENLKFIKTQHTNYLDAYGFIMDIDNNKILYTGDTANLDSFNPYLDNINELYIDVSKFGGAHIKIDDILDTLKRLKSKGIEIIPMHMDDKEYIMKLIDNFCNI